MKRIVISLVAIATVLFLRVAAEACDGVQQVCAQQIQQVYAQPVLQQQVYAAPLVQRVVVPQYVQQQVVQQYVQPQYVQQVQLQQARQVYALSQRLVTLSQNSYPAVQRQKIIQRSRIFRPRGRLIQRQRTVTRGAVGVEAIVY